MVYSSPDNFWNYINIAQVNEHTVVDLAQFVFI